MFIGLIAIVVTFNGAVMHTVERRDWHPKRGDWRCEVAWTCKYEAQIGVQYVNCFWVTTCMHN